MNDLLSFGPFILVYGPTVFGLTSALFWLIAAFVKIPSNPNAEPEKHMKQLRWQSRFIAVACVFAAFMLLLQTFCHITGF